jgi:hypothetical protein
VLVDAGTRFCWDAPIVASSQHRLPWPAQVSKLQTYIYTFGLRPW